MDFPGKSMVPEPPRGPWGCYDAGMGSPWSSAVLLALVAVCHGIPCPAEDPVVRPIAEVLSMPAAELAEGVPVRVRGVVVLTQPNLAVQEGSSGIWIRPTGTASSLVADLADGSRRMVGLGDLVEITGVVDRGGFAPTISATRILVVGTAPLPEPAAADLGRLFRGGDNAIRIEVGETFEAIVQGCRENRGEWNLVIDAAARKIVVRIAQSVMRTKPDPSGRCPGETRGCRGSTRNSRGQFLAPMLSIATAGDISVLEPAPSSPFESPRVSLDEIAAYRPEPVAQGTASRPRASSPAMCPGRYCYLQQGLVGLRVDCPSAPALEIGDVVRVAGFVDMSRTIAGIVEGVVEKTGRATPPSPVDIVPEEISRILMESHETGQMARPTNYAGVLIRFPATLIERQRFQDGWILTLPTGRRLCWHGCQPPRLTRRGTWLVQPGSDVEVMGIARIDADLPADYVPSGRNPEVRPVEFILRSAADVKIVRAHPGGRRGGSAPRSRAWPGCSPPCWRGCGRCGGSWPCRWTAWLTRSTRGGRRRWSSRPRCGSQPARGQPPRHAAADDRGHSLPARRLPSRGPRDGRGRGRRALRRGPTHDRPYGAGRFAARVGGAHDADAGKIIHRFDRHRDRAVRETARQDACPEDLVSDVRRRRRTAELRRRQSAARRAGGDPQCDPARTADAGRGGRGLRK